MSLAQFILDNMENILVEWQCFAQTVSSSKGLNRTELRDDAKRILVTIAQDMQATQTDRQQQAKSEGKQKVLLGSPETAATAHGIQRFAVGFDFEEMVSEYRALRASVIRLWIAKTDAADTGVIYELTRFNEGLDQALTESVRLFSQKIDRSRELFMGVLGHDLRTPLHVILSASQRLLRPELADEQRRELGGYIRDSAQHISRMVNDLLDVASTRLGGVLPMSPEPMDAGTVCEDVLKQFRILHPDRKIEFSRTGDVAGVWDAARLHQLLTNLMRNAFQHGDAASPVRMSAHGERDCVVFGVYNEGTPIPADLLTQIFEPMRRVEAQDAARVPGSLGLGLYIAQTIAEAHEGTLEVESTQERGTCFVASFPRQFGKTKRAAE